MKQLLYYKGIASPTLRVVRQTRCNQSEWNQPQRLRFAQASNFKLQGRPARVISPFCKPPKKLVAMATFIWIEFRGRREGVWLSPCPTIHIPQRALEAFLVRPTLFLVVNKRDTSCRMSKYKVWWRFA